jgi:hypothetical protein
MAEELNNIVAAAEVVAAAVLGGRKTPRQIATPAAGDSGSYNRNHGETAAHARLKRLACIWAQAHGYSACAAEVSLPSCRFRADVAGYRPVRREIGETAIFECKQSRADLRRDNCESDSARQRLDSLCQRRLVLERNLRVHFPSLRLADSLFPEFVSYDFTSLKHRSYQRVLRELSALQGRLFDCVKFETLRRYRCANLFYLVVPEELFCESEVPIGWGVLAETNGTLGVLRKPIWQGSPSQQRLQLLQRIAAAGTRLLNAQSGISFDDVLAERDRPSSY